MIYFVFVLIVGINHEQLEFAKHYKKEADCNKIRKIMIREFGVGAYCKEVHPEKPVTVLK